MRSQRLDDEVVIELLGEPGHPDDTHERPAYPEGKRSAVCGVRARVEPGRGVEVTARDTETGADGQRRACKSTHDPELVVEPAVVVCARPRQRRMEDPLVTEHDRDRDGVVAFESEFHEKGAHRPRVRETEGIELDAAFLLEESLQQLLLGGPRRCVGHLVPFSGHAAGAARSVFHSGSPRGEFRTRSTNPARVELRV